VHHPDYGSYFELASLDSNSLPEPEAWQTYLRAHLAPDAVAIAFSGRGVAPGGPSAVQDLRRHLREYEAIGVRFVLAPLADIALRHRAPPR
jgi:hypothetical protein